jgi:hypothetical protein
MSKESYFAHASGLDRSHHAVPDHSHAQPFDHGDKNLEKVAGRCLPQVVLYEHLHFEGGSASTIFDWKYVGDWWANKVASLVVVSGIWEFYEGRDYGGRSRTLGPGFFDNVVGTIGSMRAKR